MRPGRPPGNQEVGKREAGEFVAVLREEFARRAGRNPRYGLRAFARSAGVAPSRMSEVLRGIRGLSARNAERIARQLGFSGPESRRFCLLVESRSGRSALRRETARSELVRLGDRARPKRIDLDTFHLIADWYHLAILELAAELRLRNEPALVARALGIGEYEAAEALRRLERLGLVRVDASTGRVRATHAQTFTGGERPSGAIRSFHAQILDKARHALEEAPFGTRESASYLMAVDRRQLPRLKARVQELAAELSKEAGSAARKNELYALTVQLFPITSQTSLGDET